MSDNKPTPNSIKQKLESIGEKCCSNNTTHARIGCYCGYCILL